MSNYYKKMTPAMGISCRKWKGKNAGNTIKYDINVIGIEYTEDTLYISLKRLHTILKCMKIIKEIQNTKT